MPDVLPFHALTLLMVSGRMGWDAALHVAWNGGKHSFFTRRALVAHQSAGLAPPLHKLPTAEGSLTGFCQVPAASLEPFWRQGMKVLGLLRDQ